MLVSTAFLDEYLLSHSTHRINTEPAHWFYNKRAHYFYKRTQNARRKLTDILICKIISGFTVYILPDGLSSLEAYVTILISFFLSLTTIFPSKSIESVEIL
jgi:hypothetical protein